MPVSISRKWNTDLNYWELNPMMKTIKEFGDLYKRDKQKKKAKSSQIMWAIAMLIDCHDENPWRTTSEIDKKILIAEEFIGDKKFPWDDDDMMLLRSKYEELILSPAEKEMVRFERNLADRQRFIDEATYSFDYYEENEKSGKLTLKKGTADQLDKMMASTGKIYDQLTSIQAKLDKEKLESATKGGAVESASELGLI